MKWIQYILVWVPRFCLLYGTITFTMWCLFPVAVSSGRFESFLIRPLASLSAIVGSLAMVLMRERFRRPIANVLGRLCVLVVVLACSLVVAHSIWSVVPDVSEMVVRAVPGVLLEHVRMSPINAVWIMLFASAGLLLDWRVKRVQPSALLALVLLLYSIVAAFASTYSVTALYSVPLVQEVCLTVPRVCFGILLSLMILCLREDHPLVNVLMKNTRGGTLARRLMPAALLIPLLLGWLKNFGERHGLFSPDVGWSGLFVSMVLLFVGLIYWISRSLHQTDIERSKAAAALRDAESTRIQQIRRANIQLKEFNDQLAIAKDTAVESAHAKSEFLAIMSHEIRTPLDMVIRGSELLQRTELTPEQQEVVSIVAASGEALLEIVQNILAHSNFAAGSDGRQDIEFDIADLVETTSDLFVYRLSDSDLSFTTYISPSLPTRVFGDPARLREILINLLGNAMKFTHAGHIALRVEPFRHSVEDFIRFTVSDTGMGMDQGTVDRLFEPFEQADSSIGRKFGGSGLGLSICKSLVESMDGTIDVQSRKGKGTTFSVIVPLRPSAPSLLEELKAEGWRCTRAQDTLVIVGGMHSPLTHELVRYVRRFGVMAKHSADCEQLQRFAHKSNAQHRLVFLTAEYATPTLVESCAKSQDSDKCTRVFILCKNSDEQTAARAAFSAEVEVLRAPLKREGLIRLLFPQETSDSGRAANTFTGGKNRAVNAPAGISILIVDDNPISRRLAVLQLSQLGYAVDTAESGDAGIRLATHGNYALVFMDWRMPDMDGLTATTRIREVEASSHRHTPIIAMTAQALPGDRERCLQAGMDDYISKPASLEVLQAAIQRWV